MDITWLGNACFRLAADDVVVVTDPFPESVGLRPDMRPATVVTVSHRDPNGSNWKNVPGDPKVFAAPGEYEYRGIGVRGVMTPLPADTSQEDRSVAFAIEISGVTICHMGSVKSPPTPSQIDELSPVDVLLIPAGGGATMGVEQVFQTMQDLSPKIVIPMGDNVPAVAGEAAAQPQGMEAFVRRMGLDDVSPQPRLVVTNSNLPADMRVVVLSPRARAT
jgi:L-ascorbate metabolism protein UlaG (beta-lactamase superfamily)